MGLRHDLAPGNSRFGPRFGPRFGRRVGPYPEEPFSSLKTLVHVVHARRGPAHLGAARCRSARLAVFAPNPADRAAARAHHHALGGHGPALQPLDALEQRAVGDARRGENAVVFQGRRALSMP